MKIALVLNPRIGAKKVKNLLLLAEKRLKESNIQFKLFITQYHGHAAEIIKNIPLTEYDGIVGVGGDGTNYHVLNGLLKYHPDAELPPLGIIPAGRGNSFAKDLEIHTKEDGFAALSNRTTRAVDVCRFTQNEDVYFFVNLMGLGFVTDVAKTAARFGWAGDLSYIIGVLYRTLRLKFHHLDMEIDGHIISAKNCFVEICNSRFTGGNMLMAPEAKIDDGLFDVVVVSPVSRTNLISTFPKIFKGIHGENPAVAFYQGKTAKILTKPEKALLPDGEIFGTAPTQITILPGRVRYFS
ncbi:MAG: YegS/Rv2252/BmrU family lipid kinase [Deltaproteobacteria bacterium]|nr:YegS/Rv2252/BmrU family lipid kinase [Deltaproteobacteria bacterium]